jgi:DNA polymerase-3 subunit epsilon
VLQLHGKGQQIEVLSEGEFLQMIGGRWPAHSA